VASFAAEGSWVSATIAISTDGRRAAFSDTDKLITWDLEGGRELARSDGGKNRSSLGAIAFTEDGSLVIVPGDVALNLHDPVTHEIVYSLPDLKGVRDFAISREDRIIAVSGYSEVWYANLAAPAKLCPALLFKQELIGCYVDITRDGKLAVVAGDDRLVRVWDLEGKKLLASFAADKKLRDCAIAEDGELIVAAESAGTLHLLRLSRPAEATADSSS
jgi:WD40 repeat protein